MKENCFEPLDLDVVNDLKNIMRMKVIGNLDLILTQNMLVQWYYLHVE